MKIFVYENQCLRYWGYNQSVLKNPPELTVFPEGKKVKYNGEWYIFKEENFTNKLTKVYEAKSGKKLIYIGLCTVDDGKTNSYIEIERK